MHIQYRYTYAYVHKSRSAARLPFSDDEQLVAQVALLYHLRREHAELGSLQHLYQ